MWLRIMTAAKSWSPSSFFDTNVIDVLKPHFVGYDGTQTASDASDDKKLETALSLLGRYLASAFEDALKSFQTTPMLRTGRPNRTGERLGTHFFTQYAALAPLLCANFPPPPPPPLPVLSYSELLISPNRMLPLAPLAPFLFRHNNESYTGKSHFKLLGVVHQRPVLCFDALSVACGSCDGSYFAGENGIDQSVLRRLGLPSCSVFQLKHPEETFIVYSDSYGPLEFHPEFGRHGWTDAKLSGVPAHEMSHWWCVIARAVSAEQARQFYETFVNDTSRYFADTFRAFAHTGDGGGDGGGGDGGGDGSDGDGGGHGGGSDGGGGDGGGGEGTGGKGGGDGGGDDEQREGEASKLLKSTTVRVRWCKKHLEALVVTARHRGRLSLLAHNGSMAVLKTIHPPPQISPVLRVDRPTALKILCGALINGANGIVVAASEIAAWSTAMAVLSGMVWQLSMTNSTHHGAGDSMVGDITIHVLPADASHYERLHFCQPHIYLWAIPTPFKPIKVQGPDNKCNVPLQAFAYENAACAPDLQKGAFGFLYRCDPLITSLVNVLCQEESPIEEHPPRTKAVWNYDCQRFELRSESSDRMTSDSGSGGSECGDGLDGSSYGPVPMLRKAGDLRHTELEASCAKALQALKAQCGSEECIVIHLDKLPGLVADANTQAFGSKSKDLGHPRIVPSPAAAGGTLPPAPPGKAHRKGTKRNSDPAGRQHQTDAGFGARRTQKQVPREPDSSDDDCPVAPSAGASSARVRDSSAAPKTGEPSTSAPSECTAFIPSSQASAAPKTGEPSTSAPSECTAFVLSSQAYSNLPHHTKCGLCCVRMVECFVQPGQGNCRKCDACNSPSPLSILFFTCPFGHNVSVCSDCFGSVDVALPRLNNERGYVSGGLKYAHGLWMDCDVAVRSCALQVCDHEFLGHLSQQDLLSCLTPRSAGRFDVWLFRAYRYSRVTTKRPHLVSSVIHSRMITAATLSVRRGGSLAAMCFYASNCNPGDGLDQILCHVRDRRGGGVSGSSRQGDGCRVLKYVSTFFEARRQAGIAKELKLMAVNESKVVAMYERAGFKRSDSFEIGGTTAIGTVPMAYDGNGSGRFCWD